MCVGKIFHLKLESFMKSEMIFPLNITRTKTSIRYAKENDKEKRERRKERERKVEGKVKGKI